MAEVAKANGVPFVDLFHPTRELYAKARQAADHQRHPPRHETAIDAVAEIIDTALFAGSRSRNAIAKALEKLRQAVLDKNFYWFNRYRTVDGYNVYGGRAFVKFADKQSNYEDQQREMEILDV